MTLAMAAHACLTVLRPESTRSMDLPAHFGSWKGARSRLRKWAADGTWEKVCTGLLAQADAEGDLDWISRLCLGAMHGSFLGETERKPLVTVPGRHGHQLVVRCARVRAAG